MLKILRTKYTKLDVPNPNHEETAAVEVSVKSVLLCFINEKIITNKALMLQISVWGVVLCFIMSISEPEVEFHSEKSCPVLDPMTTSNS